MSEPEAIGEAITGGMLGRAVEPKAGEIAADGHTRERACLNCANPLQGDFCLACGQRAHVHRTLTAFAHDLLHGVLHLDGKVWRTLPLLALRPGELTRRYIDGERAKFVSPLALFLFSVFLLFAVVGQSVDLDQLDVRTNVAEARVEEEEKLRQLEARRDRAAQAGEATAALDAEIAQAKENVEALEKIGAVTPANVETFEISRNLEWLRAPVERSVRNPELLFYKVRNSAYKWSWVLIPLSAPLLWLLFPFSRRFRFYDHVVFVTYSIAFMTLLVVLLTALGWIGLGGFEAVALAAVPVHFFLQLKGSYGLSTAGALWRTVALSIFATLALFLFGMLMLLVGVL
jgi:hypothetical protein